MNRDYGKKSSAKPAKYADGGEIGDKERGLAASAGEKVGFWERLKAGNIDDPNSEAYKRFGAGRGAAEREAAAASAAPAPEPIKTMSRAERDMPGASGENRPLTRAERDTPGASGELDLPPLSRAERDMPGASGESLDKPKAKSAPTAPRRAPVSGSGLGAGIANGINIAEDAKFRRQAAAAADSDSSASSGSLIKNPKTSGQRIVNSAYDTVSGALKKVRDNLTSSAPNLDGITSVKPAAPAPKTPDFTRKSPPLDQSILPDSLRTDKYANGGMVGKKSGSDGRMYGKKC